MAIYLHHDQQSFNLIRWVKVVDVDFSSPGICEHVCLALCTAVILASVWLDVKMLRKVVSPLGNTQKSVRKLSVK